MSKKYSYENKETIKEIQEKHRKVKEEFDSESKEEKSDSQTPREKPPWWKGDDPRDNKDQEHTFFDDKGKKDDDDPTYSPDSPRDDDGPTYSPGSPRDDDGPTYSPGSPRDDDDKDGSKDEPVSESEETDDEEPEDPSAEIIQLEDLDDATVSQHRKGYIKYINEIFYSKLKDLKKTSSLKIYQLLVQNYLALDTPYRGLLVYHGLGTGKTATAISLAEGLSGQMRINTLLPASLEGNFIGEIMGDPIKGKMGWGKYG